MDEGAARFRIPADHPSLPGHFPGRPVVPGVVLLEEVAALLGEPVGGWDSVKFLAPVLPEQDVAVAWHAVPAGIAVTAGVAGRPVLSGIARPASAAPP